MAQTFVEIGTPSGLFNNTFNIEAAQECEIQLSLAGPGKWANSLLGLFHKKTCYPDERCTSVSTFRGMA